MPSATNAAEHHTYYYADGQKIPLNLSSRFLAVHTTGEGAAASAAASIAERLSTVMEPTKVLELPEHSLALIAVPARRNGSAMAAEAGSMASLRSMVASDAALQEGPPVYEIDREGPALVPVGQVLVKFKADVSAAARRRILDDAQVEIVREDYPEPGAVLAVTKNGSNGIDTANMLQETSAVEFAEPNFVNVTPRLAVLDRVGTEVSEPFTPYPEDMPPGAEAPATAIRMRSTFVGVASDPGFASQWNLQKIQAPQAWGISAGSPGISIAIIDEGCDMSHEDIAYSGGYDAYSGDSDPQPDGNDAHGTACAGVAAMRRDNAKGGVGVAPNCKVYGVRIAKGIGGGFWDTSSAKVADGIRKAVDAGADVLSNSYGVGPSSAVTSAFNYAQTNGRGGKGCPIAAAAGNDNAPPVIYPARLSPSIRGFMAVSATNEWDQRKSKTSLDGETWWGSSYGPEVDVGAPGVHIYSPDIMGGAGYSSGNYVPNFNGTSSATPHVAGLMGLILSVDSGLRSWEVEDIIKLTADDLGPSGRDDEFGFGRINCRRALEAASRLWYSISVNPEFLGAGKDTYIRAMVRFYNPGINIVRLNNLVLRSFNPSGTEIDRFEYVGNPGTVMAPRTSQDIRFNGILLRANGNQSSWSYRWSMNWGYTFWRPSAPGFPLGVPMEGSAGIEATGIGAEASQEGGSQPQGEMNDPNPMRMLGVRQQRSANGAGDLVQVDRATRAITIVVS